MSALFEHNFLYGVILCACLLAVASDIRTRKIPNIIPGAVFLVAVITSCLHGLGSFFAMFAPALGVLGLGSLAFSRQWIGGGDVKLLAACAALLPFNESIYFLLFTCVAGGMSSIAMLTYQGKLRDTLVSTFTIIHGLTTEPTLPIVPQTKTYFPYAVSIALGAIILTIIHSFSPDMLRLS